MTPKERNIFAAATETAEFYDSLDKIKEAAKVASDLLKKAKHVVFFTGAGVSTSTGERFYAINSSCLVTYNVMPVLHV